MTTAAIKRHGGKHYLADWIIGQMPPRCKNPNAPAKDDPGWLHYVEPYFGGGSVLFRQNPEGISEVVNDLDRELTNFWRVLAKADDFRVLKGILEGTPFCAESFEIACQDRWSNGSGTDPVDRAAQFFIRCRQSRQGLCKDFATLTRNRTRRGMNEQVSSWLTAIEGLPDVHQRLMRVVIMNSEAVPVIIQQDGPRTLYYADPPYLHETRSKGARDSYEHEMTVEQHELLLQTLATIQGRFLLSGYSSDLYHDYAQKHGWSCDSIEIDNKASGAKTKEKKTELLWKNY